MALIQQFRPAVTVVFRVLRHGVDTGKNLLPVFGPGAPDIGSKEYHEVRGRNPDGSPVADPVMHGVPVAIISDAVNPQTPDVTYDKYTESILAEVMSSQQSESRLESAPRFIRPKKKKKLLYK